MIGHSLSISQIAKIAVPQDASSGSVNAACNLVMQAHANGLNERLTALVVSLSIGSGGGRAAAAAAGAAQEGRADGRRMAGGG